MLTQSTQEGLTSSTAVLTRLSAVSLHALGFAVSSGPRTLAATDRTFAVVIGNGCNGAWAHLILLASVLAYPASWKEKLLGLAFGQPLLLVLNLLRVVSLFLIGVYIPAAFRAAHVYIWQFLIIGFAMLIIFVWADRFVVRRAA